MTDALIELGDKLREGSERPFAHALDALCNYDITDEIGPLGGSILGRHMTFEPRIHLARTLARQYRISSMIDLSDGLSVDLAHICDESSVAAVITAARIPIAKNTTLELALHGGEDYDLLFTAPKKAKVPSRIAGVTPAGASDGSRSRQVPS